MSILPTRILIATSVYKFMFSTVYPFCLSNSLSLHSTLFAAVKNSYSFHVTFFLGRLQMVINLTSVTLALSLNLSTFFRNPFDSRTLVLIGLSAEIIKSLLITVIMTVIYQVYDITYMIGYISNIIFVRQRNK